MEKTVRAGAVLNEWLTVIELAISATSSGRHYTPGSKKQAADVWETCLGDLGVVEVRRIVLELAQTQSWMPTVADVRRKANGDRFVSVLDGWHMVACRISEGNAGVTYSETLDPLVAQALRESGVMGTSARDREVWEATYARILSAALRKTDGGAEAENEVRPPTPDQISSDERNGYG